MTITFMVEAKSLIFELQPHTAVLVTVNPEGDFMVSFGSHGQMAGERHRKLLPHQMLWLKKARLVSPHVQSSSFTGSIMVDPDNEHVLLITDRHRMHEYIFVPKETVVT